MKMIKNPAPNFYETTCFKCGCTYMYQFDDLEYDQIDLPEPENMSDEYMQMLQKCLFKDQLHEKVYTTCPNCKEKIQHPNMGGGVSTGYVCAR